MVDPLELGKIPFYWRIKRQLVQPPFDVPSLLPFAFSFIDEFQLIIQKRNSVVNNWLKRVYKENANVGYLQEGHALAESYGGEFIEFFRRASMLLTKPPKSAADIGCGGVYLLQKLRDQGISVKGIDPSPITISAGKKAGIEIIPDFYPSTFLTEQFDILFHYDVLEHVEDPVAFLKAHHANLSSQGAIIFAVPDCSHHIELGDVSMVLHEHLNYFDDQSLNLVMRAAGFEPLLLERAKHGGVLMCCAIPANCPTVPTIASAKKNLKFENFRSKAKIALERFTCLINKSNLGEVGIYVALRAFPYLGNAASGIQLRFFDDDPGLRGHYYDGFDVPIENRDDFIARPPERVIISSLAFGEKIAQKLKVNNLKNVEIIMWPELFDQVSM